LKENFFDLAPRISEKLESTDELEDSALLESELEPELVETELDFSTENVSISYI